MITLVKIFLQRAFTNFHLEDKVDLYGGGNVTSIDETVTKGTHGLEEIINKESGNTITIVGHASNREEGALKDYVWR